jgi:hypothetical protein
MNFHPMDGDGKDNTILQFVLLSYVARLTPDGQEADACRVRRRGSRRRGPVDTPRNA